MATTEEITILRIGTDEAVKSIGDLRENVRTLKKHLEDLEIGTEEYQDTLDELKVNQNALKDAMYATSSSLEEVTKAAAGANVSFDENNRLVADGTVSYNEYVHAMASLKEEFRSTGDAVKRAQIGSRINQINDRLKEMDAAQGNFQRNVGNYEGALKKWGGGLDALDKGLKAATTGVGGLKGGVEAFSKSPAIATFSILVSTAMTLAGKLKENETAMGAFKKVTDALKPVMDGVSAVVEKLAGWISQAVDWFLELAKGSGDTFGKIVAGAVGVGNALLQYALAPIRTIIEAVTGLGKAMGKVFKGQFKEAAEEAKSTLGDIGDAWKKGFSFASNFQEGKRIGEEFVAGLGSAESTKKATEAGKALGKAVKESVEAELPEIDVDAILAEADKAMQAVEADYEYLEQRKTELARKGEANRLAVLKEADAQRLAALEEFYAAALERGDLDKALEYDKQIADLRVKIQKEADDKAEKNAKEAAEKRKAIFLGTIDAAAGLFDALAGLYESDEESQKKNAKKIQALRIATATLDTIAGAVGAYMQASKTYAPPWGQIIGAAAAATVTATGAAQIAALKRQPADGSGSVSAPSSSASSSVPATVKAPALTTQVSNVRSVTSASEEDRLNQMAKEQRVVLVMSDLEAKQDQVRTQVKEATF